MLETCLGVFADSQAPTAMAEPARQCAGTLGDELTARLLVVPTIRYHENPVIGPEEAAAVQQVLEPGVARPGASCPGVRTPIRGIRGRSPRGGRDFMHDRAAPRAGGPRAPAG